MEACKLAKEIRTESFQDKAPVSSLLRKCRTIVKLLEREDQLEWIDLELNGYSERFPTFKELKGNLPPYRWAVRQFMDERGNPILLGQKVDFLQEYPLVMSILELEGFTTTGMFIQGDEIVMMLRDKFNIPAIQSHVPPNTIVRAIDAVKTRIQEFVDNIIPELGHEPEEPTIEKLDNYALYKALNLHPRIREASEALFKDGHYSNAILDAFKEINNFTKEKSGRTDLDGKTLMEQVFKFDFKDDNITKKPLLQINDLQSQSDRDEQRGFQFLFMGAMLGIRNPKAHDRIAQTDHFRTLEYLAFASLLCKRIDEARKNLLDST